MELNAEFAVDVDRQQLCLVLESAGGQSSRGVRSRNHEYVPALRLLLARLRDRQAVLVSAVVASSRVSALPEREREIIHGPVNLADVRDVERLRLGITRSQGRIGLPAGAAKEGNNRKRIRLRLSVPGYGPQDAQRLALDLAAPSGSRQWLLQCNPARWDVWSCWENGAKELNRWTVARYLKVIRPGDGFAFWISGRDAGLYGTGRVASTPYLTTEFDKYWHSPPKEARVVDLQFDHFLFDGPLTRATLASNPESAESLIIKRPRQPNPIPLTPEQWRILSVVADRTGRSERPNPAEVVVTSRALGSVPTETATNTPARDGVIRFREAKLVKAYQEYLGRELRHRNARLPSGERLECDAFDAHVWMIIEAKASNSRSDVRMAIGQLLDYRHHIDPSAAIAVLLPDQPSTSVADLLRVLDIKLIYRSGTSFIGPK